MTKMINMTQLDRIESIWRICIIFMTPTPRTPWLYSFSIQTIKAILISNFGITDL